MLVELSDDTRAVLVDVPHLGLCVIPDAHQGCPWWPVRASGSHRACLAARRLLELP